MRETFIDAQAINHFAQVYCFFFFFKLSLTFKNKFCGCKNYYILQWFIINRPSALLGKFFLYTFLGSKILQVFSFPFFSLISPYFYCLYCIYVEYTSYTIFYPFIYFLSNLLVAFNYYSILLLILLVTASPLML